MKKGVELGQLLIRENLISEEQLDEVLKEQQQSGDPLTSILIRRGYVSPDYLVAFLSRQFSLPITDPFHINIPEEVIELIPPDIAHQYYVIPIKRDANFLTIAVMDPLNLSAIEDIKFLTDSNIEIAIATEESIRKALEKYYEEEDVGSFLAEFDEYELEAVKGQEEDSLKDIDIEDAPVVKLANYLLKEAVNKRASDIHIEPYEKFFRVRFRIDGVLHEIIKPPLSLKAPLVARIKVMAKLDIAERRLPQDGRIKIRMGKNREIDFRVSTLPTLYGEKVVLRILDPGNVILDLEQLGFEEEDLEKFRKAIHAPYGIVLVTGPTGSGKTTTLYGALNELNEVTSNISTAEDPVEYNLPGINQVQTHEAIGLTFANCLRAFLRQDPDIIMVGEIRDYETAEIAIKAALTGHLVLSTLHTNDAPSTIMRLLNMGIEPFLVTSSVTLVLAQRLVRRICPKCMEEISVPHQKLRDLEVPEEMIETIRPARGVGCEECGMTGYKGRIGLYEVMPFDEDLKEMVIAGASTTELKREAIRLGMKTLRQTGILKIAKQMTTIEEVERITASDK